MKHAVGLLGSRLPFQIVYSIRIFPPFYFSDRVKIDPRQISGVLQNGHLGDGLLRSIGPE